MQVRTKKKLIEVALPLEAINKASAREKSIRHGHPSTLHLWWARRPLAAARAVIFAQMVDDPSSLPDLFPTEKAQEKERKRLFKIIEDLVQWENTNNEEVLAKARDEIWQSWRRACAENADHPQAKELFNRHKLPAFHDPFAGGGALPLEAQRLGLESYASDLNPVAVLINKAMIEIPPKFAGKPPVNPQARKDKSLFDREWKGAQGLAEDVRYYGKWMRDEAEKRIGHLYPKVKVTADMAKERPDLKSYVGRELTVIAWLWARTVKSPNPAFANVDVPLASTFMLSTKSGKEAYVEPVVEGESYKFRVKLGKPKNLEAVKSGTKLSRGANFRCVMSGSPIAPEHVYSEANAGRMSARLMAIVVEGDSKRIYLSPSAEQQVIAESAKSEWKPDVEMPDNPRWFSPPLYGLKTYGDLFTDRQLIALTNFSDLVQEAREQAKSDALASGLPNDGKPLHECGVGAAGYADAVALYLALGVDKAVDYNTSLVVWSPSRDQAKSTFARQALPMVWDYAEINPFAKAAGDFLVSIEGSARYLNSKGEGNLGFSFQADAASQTISHGKVVSTDPPYYDNIGYADLSDFFYVWLRPSLRITFPEQLATLVVPKTEELVATPYRHGSRDEAEAFFLKGMTKAMHQLGNSHAEFPVTIYYAFKQSESETDFGTASTGWETFLDAVIRAGFVISGTWPMRTERDTRSISIGTNALASSIVLVCHTRLESAQIAERRDFLAALKIELPLALRLLQKSNIAPVDLAQAAIGPGMAIYTRYAKVVDSSGKPVSVREALAHINQMLDEVFAEQEGDFDADTRWAVAWFEQHGFEEGQYGVADTLSKAKNTAVSGLVQAGIVSSKGGKVRLLAPAELPADWDPEEDNRLTVWETVHHLIRVLEAGGEEAAAQLAAKLGSKAEVARELAYRLYTISERKRRANEALRYNGLVQSWPEIMRLAQERATPKNEQTELF
jgi:putative DNA methylase